MKAVGYIRVSTEGQERDGLSLDAQRDSIRRYCELHGLELLEIYRDTLSGKRADNRPGLKSALCRVCKEKAVLIVYSLSRLARSTLDCINIVSALDKCGADLASISERIDTSSPMGRFFFRLMASLGELERDQISQRTLEIINGKRSRNERISRFAPYGWDFDGDMLKVNPSEQIILGAIISRRREGGGLRVIANELNAAGVTTKYGKRWAADRIKTVVDRSKHENQVRV